jgi:hypothetical protein
MTEEEKVWWDRIEDTEAEIVLLKDMLAEDPENEVLRKELDRQRELRELYARAAPDYKPRPSRRHIRSENAGRRFLKRFNLTRESEHDPT